MTEVNIDIAYDKLAFDDGFDSGLKVGLNEAIAIIKLSSNESEALERIQILINKVGCVENHKELMLISEIDLNHLSIK